MAFARGFVRRYYRPERTHTRICLAWNYWDTPKHLLSKTRATVFAAVAPGQVSHVLNDSLVNFGWSVFLLSAAVLPRLFHEVACNKPIQACRKYSL